MQFNVRRRIEGVLQAAKSVEFERLEELMAFIMGCDKPVLIVPDWQSKAWDMLVVEKDDEDGKKGSK